MFRPGSGQVEDRANDIRIAVADTPGLTTLPPCGAQYATSRSNIEVQQTSSNQGYTINANLMADPQFATIEDTPPTAPNYADRSVLLPGIGSNGTPTDSVERYVLGPEQMTGDAIGKAVAEKSQTGAWVVNYSMRNKEGTALWDTVTEEDFHQYLAFELDGVVYTAPIIQPQQETFSSFDGNGEISGGNLNGKDAKRLAEAMNFGALPIQFRQVNLRS